MRRVIILIFILAGFSVPGTFGEDTLIPRRIRIVNPDGKAPPMLPSLLYARLASITPLVIASPEDIPHNTIILAMGNQLSLTLKDREKVVDIREYPLEIAENLPEAAAEFDKLAKDWEPYLGLVEPDVSEELEVRREEMEAEISFEEKLITPFQATLWIPLALRQAVITDGDFGSSKFIWQWPLRGDFTWFFSDNLGISGSFRFEYGDHISFAVDSDWNALDTTVLMLMPGIGFQVRTVGRVSAEFGISMFFGAVHITANEDSDIPSLNAGESTWVYYPVLSLEPAIVWSPTAKWSVKFRILELQLGLAVFGDSNDAEFGTAENTLILNYLQIGAAYRW